jgi:SAM-dependent methyltransferase
MVAPSNAEMASAWDGDEGEHWAAHSERYDAALRAHRPIFNARAAITATDTVLDVGCGNGESACDAAGAAKEVLGVDLSAAMVRRARARAAAAGLANVTFEQADAQVYPFRPASFDAVISRAGAMFFGDRPAAFANLARALRPGGRMVLLAWRELHRNDWITAIRDSFGAEGGPPPGAPGPFALADPGPVTETLVNAGFRDVGFEPVDVPVYFGTDVDDAMVFATGTGLGRSLLGRLDETGRAQALARLRSTMAAHATAGGVHIGSSGWLVTAFR